jgi:hypothetical protein
MDGVMVGERVLECRGLRRSFGKIIAVDGVGFHIDPGETYGLRVRLPYGPDPGARRVAHITPQAWGNDAFAKLVGHGASIAGILPQLGILAAYAPVLARQTPRA